MNPPQSSPELLPGERPYPLFRGVFAPLLFISLVAPNLVFSGPWFFSTLHLMKWALALVPLALCGLLAGGAVAVRGTARTFFAIDGFAVVWLVLILYVTAQPFWAGLRSPETFFREWFFFASLWLAYVLACRETGRGFLGAVMWGSLVNCAVSVVFAELQVRGADLPFFILPTPGYYIANTGQQNMLALWLAVGGLNGAFLIVSGGRKGFGGGVPAAGLTAVVFWGLISTTSRSGILAFLTGLAVLSCYYLRNLGRENLPRVAAAVLLFCGVAGLNLFFNEGRWGILMHKMENVLEDPLSIANRDSIWATSWTMYAERPLKGVGLGQYKWHYLDAQREMLKRWPGMKWQYTHWAHNEFLQLFAETGTVGGLLLVFLWVWWGWGAFSAFLRKKKCSPGAFWGSSMAALFLFNALWTRPFHRIEIVLWLSLAFAAANREMLDALFQPPPPEDFEKGGRLIGAVAAAVCALGLVYFGLGARGDRLLRLASDEEDPAGREAYIEGALSSLMVRDLAEKERAYNLIFTGRENKDPEMISEGLNDLMAYFGKQPHVRELTYLKDWSRRLENEPLYDMLNSYGGPASGEPLQKE
ncbi:MAG: O-antigen ligase family protein [Aminivibrio sp.]